MVKSVVVPNLVTDAAELEALEALFRELGFSRAEGWDDEHSRGSPFLAQIGAVELVHGRPPADVEVIIEVADVQLAREIVRAHGVEILSDLQPTHWNSSLFIARIGSKRVAFFSYLRQAGNNESQAA